MVALGPGYENGGVTLNHNITQEWNNIVQEWLYSLPALCKYVQNVNNAILRQRLNCSSVEAWRVAIFLKISLPILNNPICSPFY